MSRHNEELKVEVFITTIGSYVTTLIDLGFLLYLYGLQNVATFLKIVMTQLEQES